MFSTSAWWLRRARLWVLESELVVLNFWGGEAGLGRMGDGGRGSESRIDAAGGRAFAWHLTELCKHLVWLDNGGSTDSFTG